jgi:oligo-1,6-glucosidase
MLNTFILSMRGTPYLYNGDELAMTNAGFSKITDYRDMATLNEYQNQLNKKGNIPAFLKRLQFECRDNGRTPFQWDNSVNAGFSTGVPWIQVNKNFTSINVADQEKDSSSVLNYVKKMIQIRKSNQVLVYGKYNLIDKDNPTVYAYTREWKGMKMLVLLNFSNQTSKVKTGLNLAKAKPLIQNYSNLNGETLQPYEAVIYQLLN